MKLGIEENRKQRYKSKISYSRERLLDLEDWINEREKKSILALEKAFQEAIEAITDAFAMLLSDMKLEISDDYSNIEKISKRGIITKEQEKVCIEANGLRNRVIHKYNSIDEERFLDSLKSLIPELNIILDSLEKFVENG